MVQSPSWAANWFAASQDIPRISRNPKVHYRTHKRPPPVTIQGQPNPVHTPTSHFLEILLNMTLSSTSGSPKWTISLRFLHQIPVYASPLTMRATYPVRHVLLDFINWTISGERFRSLSSSLCSFLHSPVTSSRFRSKYSPQHPIPKHLQPTFLPQCQRITCEQFP